MVAAPTGPAWESRVPRLSARLHLLGLIAVVVVPLWLFAAYLLAQYAFKERDRFERDALQVARQVSLVVEGDLDKLLSVLEGLAKSPALAKGDLAALREEAARLVQGTDRVIVLRDLDRRLLLDTALPSGAALPAAPPLSQAEIERLKAGRPAVSNVYASPVGNEFRVAVMIPVRGPAGESLVLALTVPTAHIRDAMMPTVPAGWTIGVGDRDGNYVTRSQNHDEVTGKPGLPEYLAKVRGESGTFTASNFQGVTLLAGYYRSQFSDWFYTANVPLSVVEAPLWRSLAAIGAIGLVAMLVSAALAYVMGNGIARAARDLAARAEALGHGRPVEPMSSSVAEFAAIADALVNAEQALAERASEMEVVLETVPAAVWFTYDPTARQVIRNRFAAELMGVPTDSRKSFGAPDRVIDTLASKDGRPVSRDDRPLTRAMRGQSTDHEEFAYILLDGSERILLSSARPIRDTGGKIIGAVQISLDITERKRIEEQRKLLVNELNHRVKNTLAIVQSIASQTLRSADNLAEAGRSLSGRLVSLAKAHDILTQEHWSGADIEELVAAALSPHAGQERFRLEGGPVRLGPNLALSLALAIHELATNATKYGAFSTPGGTVQVSWNVSEAEGRRHLRIEWREAGGPPVRPAERKGFGTRMLESIFAAESGGSVAFSFDGEGLACVLQVDLPAEPQPQGRVAG